MKQGHETRAFAGDEVVHGSCLVDVGGDHGFDDIFVFVVEDKTVPCILAERDRFQLGYVERFCREVRRCLTSKESV